MASSNALNDELITGEQSYKTINDRINNIVLNPGKHGVSWWMVFLIGFGLLQVLGMALFWLLWRGVGVWGINKPVMWGWDIINFVWWIGIGHAGTLISAILLLLRQAWRTSINRFAEAMTIFAVSCAGIFPALHTGRPWVDYWLFPYPNVVGMWPQFRSPLLWDVFAVSTYATVSILFWAVGLLPDIASLRDKSRNKVVRSVYGILSLGWTGSVKHWHRYEQAYILLAGLSTPLVLSVHTIVSFDFAVSIVPGWHTTIFPPYFVAGAVYAGFAMVLTLAIPVRAWYGLKDYITMRHIDWMAKVMLATGLIVFYGYILEMFYGMYSGNVFELGLVKNRLYGPYAWSYFMLLFCNGVVPQLLWFPKIRRNLVALWLICQVVSIGMWLERFVIISVSLLRDFLPSSWGFFTPTMWDIGLFLGTMGQFMFLMFGFLRVLPMINVFEMKELWYKMTGHHHTGTSADHGAHSDKPASDEATGHGGPPLLGQPAADKGE